MDSKSLVPGQENSQTPAARDDSPDQLVAFRWQMNRMFDDFFKNVRGRPFRPLGGGCQGAARIEGTKTDKETTDVDKDVVFTAELPGLGETDFELTLAGDILTITARKRLQTSKGTVTFTRQCAETGRGAKDEAPDRGQGR
jgi:HSP20 family molecular chaperone IbpA